MGTPQNETLRIRPGTRLVISEGITCNVVEAEGYAREWKIEMPTAVIPSYRWLRRNTLRLTVPPGHSCTVTLMVPPGTQPSIKEL